MHVERTTAAEPLEATAGVCPMDGRVCVKNLHQKEGARVTGSANTFYYAATSPTVVNLADARY